VTWTPEALDALVRTCDTTIAPRLRWAVQRRDRVAVAELLESLDVIELRALAVVLAAQSPRIMSRPDDGVFDEVAISRACNGERIELTRAEKAAAVKALHARGLTTGEIAHRLGTNPSTARKLMGEAA
jgi:hypothetical protein